MSKNVAVAPPFKLDVDQLEAQGVVFPEHRFSDEMREQMSLDEIAATVTDTMSADSTLLKAYAADHSQVSQTGLPEVDNVSRTHVSGIKKLVLTQFESEYRTLEQGAFQLPFRRSRQERRNIREKQKAVSTEEQLRLGSADEWTKWINKTYQLGLYRSEALKYATMSILLAYLPEMGESGQEAADSHVYLPDADQSFLFGNDNREKSEKRTGAEIVQALRQKVPVDLSKQLLDDRTTMFVDLATVETAKFITEDLLHLGRLGRKKEARAAAMFEKYRTELLRGDLATKCGILDEIGQVLKDFAHKTPNNEPRTRQLILKLAQRSTRVVDTIQMVGDQLCAVYNTLGYPLSPLLQGGEPEEISSGADEFVQNPITPEPEIPETQADEEPTASPEPTPVDQAQFEQAIAEQLDEILLPTERSGLSPEDFARKLRRIAQDTAQQTPGGQEAVIWDRLNDLVDLSREYGGRLYRSKSHSEGFGIPYFVSVFNRGSNTYAVAESPVYGNATYVVSQRHTPGTWLEALMLSRRDLRELGGVAIRHSKQSPYGPRHRGKIQNAIIDFSSTPGLR